MIARIVLALIIATALGFAIGCSKSSTTQASFGSSSDSSSSPFKSSSKSSSGDDEKEGKDEDKETAFQRDVRNYTVEFARNADDSDIATFQRGIASIAEGYGITNWEQAEGIFVAIGRGLGESKRNDADAKRLAVVLSNESYDDLILIQTGFESRRTQ